MRFCTTYALLDLVVLVQPAVDEASAPLGEPKFRITKISCPASNGTGPHNEHEEALTAFSRFTHLAGIASGITELIQEPCPSVHAGQTRRANTSNVL